MRIPIPHEGKWVVALFPPVGAVLNTSQGLPADFVHNAWRIFHTKSCCVILRSSTPALRQGRHQGEYVLQYFGILNCSRVRILWGPLTSPGSKSFGWSLKGTSVGYPGPTIFPQKVTTEPFTVQMEKLSFNVHCNIIMIHSVFKVFFKDYHHPK